jgi:hypothetical protein
MSKKVKKSQIPAVFQRLVPFILFIIIAKKISEKKNNGELIFLSERIVRKKRKKEKKQQTDKQRPSTSKQQKGKQRSDKPLNKKILLIIPVIIIICIVGWILIIQSPAVAKAQLIIESGDVQIKHEKGQWIDAENGMDLFQSDSVKTGDNTAASIILFESSIIRLDSNTEVTIQEIIREEETSVKIQQDEGRTWNTIRKISGIDNYEIQTPTTIASVRGTSFLMELLPDGNTTVGVSNGTVNITILINGSKVGSIQLNEGESITIDTRDLNKSLIINPFEKDGWVLLNEQRDLEYIYEVKARLYSKIEEYIPEIKETYGINDEELDALIEGYLLEYWDLPEDTPDWIRELIKIT